MDTNVVFMDETHIESQELTRAGMLIKQGELVAFPTETVYGLGGDALQEDSARKIYAAKGRPSDNPLIIHIAKWKDIYYICREIPKAAEKLAEAFWPGPPYNDSKEGRGSTVCYYRWTGYGCSQIAGTCRCKSIY